MKSQRDRRQFLAVTGGSALAAGMVSVSGSGNSNAAVCQTKQQGEKESIKVNHEWGTLKEVVCGIPNFMVPDPLPVTVKNWIPEDGYNYYKSMEGKFIEQGDPKHHKKVVAQMDAAIEILKSRGITVHRPEKVTEAELSYLGEIFPPAISQFFPRDSMLVIGNHFIEPSLYFPMRLRERFGIRRAIEERLYASNAKIVSMPPPIPVAESDDGGFGPGPFIEGGDTFVLGRDIFVGVSGNASNSAGVRWLQQYLGSDYRVHEVKLTTKFLHLDCCFATPRRGLAIACMEAFPDGLPDYFKDWKILEVSYEDAHVRLGTNVLVLDENALIMDTQSPRLAKALRKEGIEVFETPFDALYKFGGAFRCWHHPLVRESTLESA